MHEKRTRARRASGGAIFFAEIKTKLTVSMSCTNSDPSKIVCNYDEAEAPKRKRGAGGQAKVQELQARIGVF